MVVVVVIILIRIVLLCPSITNKEKIKVVNLYEHKKGLIILDRMHLLGHSQFIFAHC